MLQPYNDSCFVKLMLKADVSHSLSILTSVIICAQDVLNLISVECFMRHPEHMEHKQNKRDHIFVVPQVAFALSSENKHLEQKRAAHCHHKEQASKHTQPTFLLSALF